MDIERICREALERLRLQTEQRIEAFKRQSQADAEHVRRSMAQRMRWHAKQMMAEFK